MLVQVELSVVHARHEHAPPGRRELVNVAAAVVLGVPHLVRRVKQGVAEWYRLQLKEKIWKGLVEHCMDGWNIGTPAYGFLADRIPHPVPFKAAQGRTKSRLVLDPDRAPVIAQMYTWRTVDKIGCPAIAARLNANPAAQPGHRVDRAERPDHTR
jgi:site-specific DNA recombinase